MKKIKLTIEITKVMTDEEHQHEVDYVKENYGISYEEAVEKTAREVAVEPFIDPNDEEYEITVEVEDIENSPAE